MVSFTALSLVSMFQRSTRSYIGCVDSVEEFTVVVRKGSMQSATISIMSERVREMSFRQDMR